MNQKEQRSRSLIRKVDLLRTKAWILEEVNRTSMSLYKFGDKFARDGDCTSSKQNDWAKGIRKVNPKTVDKIKKKIDQEFEFEETCGLYYLPLWDLMKPTKISKKKLQELRSPYVRTYDNKEFWMFPNDFIRNINYEIRTPKTLRKYLKKTNNIKSLPNWYFPNVGDMTYATPLHPPFVFVDSKSLAMREDIFGFMAIFSLIKENEKKGDIDAIHRYLRHAYWMLPSLARTFPFNLIWREIGECLLQVHLQHNLLITSYFPDWERMEKYIKLKAYSINQEVLPFNHMKPFKEPVVDFIRQDH